MLFLIQKFSFIFIKYVLANNNCYKLLFDKLKNKSIDFLFFF